MEEMKTIVNKYSLYSERDWNERGLISDVLHMGMVFKEGEDFFMEINGKKFIVPSKNGMVKKKIGYSIILDDIGVKKLGRMLEAGSD